MSLKRNINLSIIILLIFSNFGCQNLLWWKKKEQKPEKISVSIKDDDAEMLSKYRNSDTIAPIPKKENKKSILWSNSQKNEIERHLGVIED
ncbi:MAG: hypothetical protein LBJ67_16920 [Planctomycetaceae bacterium]|jgi:hypothetical protein|nr:hypothetical protein [Planctomycetaceae bacterium]